MNYQYQHHVLLAEDEVHLRYTLSLILKRNGYRVTVVSDGRAALEIVQSLRNTSEQINMLITDVKMPDLTGLELIDELERLNIKMPIIVITGYGNREMWLKIFKMPMVDYIEKPFDPEDLLELMRRVFQKHGYVQEDETPFFIQLRQQKTV